MKLMFFSKNELKEVFPLNTLKIKQDRDDNIELPLRPETVFYITKSNFEEVYSDSDRIEVEVIPEDFKKYYKSESFVAIADNELVYMNHFFENFEHYHSDIDSILSLDFFIRYRKRFMKMKFTDIVKQKKFFSRTKTFYCMFIKDRNEELTNEEFLYDDYEERYIPPVVAYRKVLTNSATEFKEYVEKWMVKGYAPYLLKTEKEINGIVDRLEMASLGKSIDKNQDILAESYAENPALLVHELKMDILPFREAKKQKPDMTEEEYSFWLQNINEVMEEEKVEKEEILDKQRSKLLKTLNDEYLDFYYKYTMEKLTGYTGKYIGKKAISEKHEKNNH